MTRISSPAASMSRPPHSVSIWGIHPMAWMPSINTAHSTMLSTVPRPMGSPQQRDRNDNRPHKDGGRAIGDAHGVGHALLKDAPRLQAHVGLEHHGDAHRADQRPQGVFRDAPDITVSHTGNPFRYRQPQFPQSAKPRLR